MKQVSFIVIIIATVVFMNCQNEVEPKRIDEPVDYSESPLIGTWIYDGDDGRRIKAKWIFNIDGTFESDIKLDYMFITPIWYDWIVTNGNYTYDDTSFTIHIYTGTGFDGWIFDYEIDNDGFLLIEYPTIAYPRPHSLTIQ